MGTHYDFVCHSCGYQAVVSGKKDIGMACATTTISCIECQELYDIVISNEPWLAMEPGFKVSQDLINCPVIRKHDCSIWKYPYPCPKCGSNMQRGPVVLLWD